MLIHRTTLLSQLITTRLRSKMVGRRFENWHSYSFPESIQARTFAPFCDDQYCIIRIRECPLSALSKAIDVYPRTGMIPTMHEQSPRHPAWYLIHRLSHQQVSLRRTYMSRARLVVTCPYGEIGQLSPKGSRSGSALGPHGRRPLDSVQKYFQRFLMAGHHKLGNLKVSTSSARWHSAVRRSIHYTCPEKQPIIVRVLVAFGGVVIRITSGTGATFQFCRCTMQWQRNLKLAGV